MRSSEVVHRTEMILFAMIVLVNALSSDSLMSMPEQIHTAFGMPGNGSKKTSTMTISWATKGNASNEVMFVEYGREDDEEHTSWRRKNATDVVVVRGNYTKFHVPIEMDPGVTYAFSVGDAQRRVNGSLVAPRREDDTDWSPRLAFFGDLGYTNDQLLNYLSLESEQNAIDAIVLFGDMVYWPNGESENSFMRDVQTLSNGSVPFHVSPGNGDSGNNFTIYRNDFRMPEDSSDSLWHSFNLGPCHVVGVSTEVFYYQSTTVRQNMMRWLEADLREANANRVERPWIVVHYHRPAYSENYAPPFGDTYARTVFEPLMFDYGVDLIFSGHVHNQERSYPVFNGTVVSSDGENPYENARAPVYVVSGNPSNAESTSVFEYPPQPWSAWRSYAFGYAHLDVVNRTSVHVDIVSTQLGGQVVDEFWLTKNVTCNFGPRCSRNVFPSTKRFRGAYPRPAAKAVYASWRERQIASKADAPKDQIATLRSMFNTFGGTRWYRNNEWISGHDPCKDSHQWYGVSCVYDVDVLMSSLLPHDVPGVSSIQLPYNGLSGSLNDVVDFASLSSSLQLLDLSDNAISGSLEYSLRSSPMTRLHTLLIDGLDNGVWLTGTIPNELGSSALAPHLKTLSLQRHRMRGNVPEGLGNMTCDDGSYAFTIPGCLVWLRDNDLSGALSMSLCRPRFTEVYITGDEGDKSNFTCPVPCLHYAYAALPSCGAEKCVPCSTLS